MSSSGAFPFQSDSQAAPLMSPELNDDAKSRGAKIKDVEAKLGNSL